MCHHEQTKLRGAQTSSGQRQVVSLRDPARGRAHREANAIATFVQLRKISARHIPVLARLRLCTTVLCEEIDNSEGAEKSAVTSRLGTQKQERRDSGEHGVPAVANFCSHYIRVVAASLCRGVCPASS